MDPRNITNSSFKRKRKLKDFLDELSNMVPTDSSDTGTIQSLQNNILFMELGIHNQFPDIELVSPVYYTIGTVCYPLPDQRIDVGSKMRIWLIINRSRRKFSCALMYRLKRKNTDEFNEATCTQLVMIWEMDIFEKLYLIPRLIEHDKGQVWDRDKRN
jgi:hypothetical protein